MLLCPQLEASAAAREAMRNFSRPQMLTLAAMFTLTTLQRSGRQPRSARAFCERGAGYRVQTLKCCDLKSAQLQNLQLRANVIGVRTVGRLQPAYRPRGANWYAGFAALVSYHGTPQTLASAFNLQPLINSRLLWVPFPTAFLFSFCFGLCLRQKALGLQIVS